NRLKTSSRWAMKFGSNAWAWTRKAVYGFHAGPPWRSATNKWAGPEKRRLKVAVRGAVKEANRVHRGRAANIGVSGENSVAVTGVSTVAAENAGVATAGPEIAAGTEVETGVVEAASPRGQASPNFSSCGRRRPGI